MEKLADISAFENLGFKATPQTSMGVFNEIGVVSGDGVPVSFQEMYDGSYFTIVGAGGPIEDWVDGVTEMLVEAGIGVPKKFIRFTGSDFNAEYSPKNEFQNDVTCLAFPLDGLDGGKLAMFRLQFGAKWFDDMVDNSVR